MHSVDLFCIIIDYNYWAHYQLWKSLQTISESDFKREIDYGLGALHRHMVHMMWAETAKLARIQGKPIPDWTSENYTKRDTIISQWQQTKDRYLLYVKTLTTEELARQISKKETLQPIYETLLHVVNHATDHRAQMLRMIGDSGGQTFSQDMAYYFREMHDENITKRETDMAALEYIRLSIDYNYWAYHQLWQSVQTISEADFKRDIDYGLGSLHRHMVHVMWAEALWLRRIQGQDRINWTIESHPTRAAIIEQWQTVENDMRTYGDSLTLKDLDREILVFSQFANQTYSHTVHDILLHVVNHGTDHRAQMLRMIGDSGGQTFPQDMAYYFRALRAKQ